MNDLSKRDVKCPYDGFSALLVNSSYVYGKHSKGLIYYCPKCGAYVSCHRGTAIPMGYPAEYETRMARHMAHEAFDGMRRRFDVGRDDAYAWLKEVTGFPHIGMMQAKDCLNLVNIILQQKKRPKKVQNEKAGGTSAQNDTSKAICSGKSGSLE